MHLHYEIHGSGPTTLVMTHGLGMNSRVWRAQVDRLRRDFRIVTWDLRGHGRSGGTDAPFALHDLAEDLRTVLDEAAIPQAVVVGHSAGGVISLRFVLDHPERTAGLVLTGTSSNCGHEAADFYEKLSELALKEGVGPVRRNLGLEGFQQDAPLGDPFTLAGVMRCMSNLLHEPLTPELGRIACPTLIVVGEKDFVGVGGSVTMSRRIQDSRLEIVPDRGHSIFLENPEGFSQLVREFVSGLPNSTVSSGQTG
jgi:pimeloyl-ACP methyl ester carboxylesterase